MSDYYILEDGQPKAISDFVTWALWFEQNQEQRIVEKTTLGKSEVSTVFLGLNHAFNSGPPLLYETLVFGSAFDGEMRRYCTVEEAREGHAAMCAKVGAAVS